MLTLSDTSVLKGVLELQQMLSLVREATGFQRQVEYCNAGVPQLHLARMAENHRTQAHYRLLAGELHRLMRARVAELHQVSVQLARSGKLGTQCAQSTCAFLGEVLGVAASSGKPDAASNLWELSLMVGGFELVLGAFDCDTYSAEQN